MIDSTTLFGRGQRTGAAGPAEPERDETPSRRQSAPGRAPPLAAPTFRMISASVGRLQAIFRPEAALSETDARVLAETEQRSARIAAVTHLFVVILIASVVLLAFNTEHHDNRIVVALVMADLVVSLFGIPFARRPFAGAWLSWVAGLLDVAVLLGIVFETVRFQTTIPGPFQPTLTGLWAIFLSLALSAMRGRPGLLLMQTVLFAVGLTYVATVLAVEIRPWPGTLAVVFGPARSTIRIVTITVAGAMLLIVTLRARINLCHAIVGSRRAANLSRYLAPSVASMVADADIAALREGREQNIAILFADVRGFSTLTETMPPRDIATFLNTFRRLAVAAIESEGGVIDKFIGDEVMGLFGVPAAGSHDAIHAILAARSLRAAIRAWNVERRAAELPRVDVGIGIHYGPVFTGVLGEDRLEFTVLGSTVNIARRLEELTKALDCGCIVSAQAVQAARAAQPLGWSCRPLSAQAIRGHREPVDVFTLTGDACAVP